MVARERRRDLRVRAPGYPRELAARTGRQRDTDLTEVLRGVFTAEMYDEGAERTRSRGRGARLEGGCVRLFACAVRTRTTTRALGDFKRARRCRGRTRFRRRPRRQFGGQRVRAARRGGAQRGGGAIEEMCAQFAERELWGVLDECRELAGARVRFDFGGELYDHAGAGVVDRDIDRDQRTERVFFLLGDVDR